MTDNKDLKSKILLMRQKSFGEKISEPNEKNDNEKPENYEIKKDDPNIKNSENEDKVNQNDVYKNSQSDLNSEISGIIENLNKVAKTNEKAFNLLANKFNDSVEVVLELTQRVEKLETITKLQSMQENTKKPQQKTSQKGLKFFIFLLLVSGISYFLYKFKVDISILKEISKDFLAIIGK